MYYRDEANFKKYREIGEMLVQTFPRDRMWHSNLAGTYLDAGEPEKALTEAEAAARNGARFAFGYDNYWEALLELSRIEEAKTVAKKAIAGRPPRSWISSVAPESRVCAKRWAGTDTGNRMAREPPVGGDRPVGAGQQRGSVRTPEGRGGDVPPKGEIHALTRLRYRSNAAGDRDGRRFRQRSVGKVRACGHSPAFLGDGPLGPGIREEVRGPADCKGKYTGQSGGSLCPGTDVFRSGARRRSLFSLMVSRKAANWTRIRSGSGQPGAGGEAHGQFGARKKAYEDSFAFWKDADRIFRCWWKQEKNTRD